MRSKADDCNNSRMKLVVNMSNVEREDEREREESDKQNIKRR